MIFKKRVFAPIVCAWTLATAGMAAFAFSVAPEGISSAAGSQISIGDIQIGERGNQTRIAFLCKGACVLEKRETDLFYLSGVEAAFELDLSMRSERVQRLQATPEGAGAMLRIETNGVIDYANVKSCVVGGQDAACLDLFFDPARAKSAQRATEKKSALVRSEERLVAAMPAARPKIAVAKPALREGSPDRYLKFAELAAPERLEPPTGAILAKVQPIEPSVEVRKPTIRESEPLVEPAVLDFKDRIFVLLKKDLSPAFCNNADATLQADAWALGAMVDTGLCAASRGDVVEADATLARLLEYTPDNYEALVGRAVIAEQAQERGVARKYYQDALNSLPPIEESNRIVQAMASLN